jgi:hypothetical protein
MAEAPRLPVTCPHYDPLPGARRCRHFLANGACERPDELMCVEWLKVNGPRDGTAPQAGERERPPGANAPAATEATGKPLEESGKVPDAATTEPASQAGSYAPVWWEMFGKGPPKPVAPKRRPPHPPAPPAPPRETALPAPLASADDVTALAARCGEVRLENDELGAFWLVAEPTGLDRLELTFRDAAALAAICMAFPGARVTELRRGNKST